MFTRLAPHAAHPEGDRGPEVDRDVPIVIAGVPASTRQRRIAFGVLVILVAFIALTIPFANIELAHVEPFVSVTQTVMCFADLLTATLLFAGYSVYPRRAILALASGFIFSGLFAFLHALAFPGAFTELPFDRRRVNQRGLAFRVLACRLPAGRHRLCDVEGCGRSGKSARPTNSRHDWRHHRMRVGRNRRTDIGRDAGRRVPATSLPECDQYDIRCECRKGHSRAPERDSARFVVRAQTHGSWLLADCGFGGMAAQLRTVDLYHNGSVHCRLVCQPDLCAMRRLITAVCVAGRNGGDVHAPCQRF